MLNEKKYPITLWEGISKDYILRADGTLAEERLTEMIDAGLNLITASYSPEINKKVLEFCKCHGIKCTVLDSRIMDAVKQEPGWEHLLEQATDDYKDFPALFNYFVNDEPHSSEFAALKKVCDKLRALDPAHEAYINLYPMYANAEQQGSPTYEQHVEDFIQQVQPTLISFDHYHFRKNIQMEAREFKSERDRMIYENAFLDKKRAGFFDNIEQIRTSSLRHGLPYMIIVLLTEHFSYRNLTEAELRWEVFQSLAYGVSCISYFTYWTPKAWKNGMISSDGQKCQHYYDVQKINADLQCIGTQLVGAKSEAVFHIGECSEKVRFFNGYAGIDKIEIPTATVGFFDNGMLLLSNKDFLNAAEAVITTDKVLLHLDKRTGEWKLLENKRLMLAAGDGELLLVQA